MASQYDIETAGYRSFRDVQSMGMDPETAEDLGYATPENYAQQVASGKEVGQLLTATTVTIESDQPRPDDYKGAINSGWLDQTPEQKEVFKRGKAEFDRLRSDKPKEQ
jgi:hypothetical protein